jgi:hypothetical protein
MAEDCVQRDWLVPGQQLFKADNHRRCAEAALECIAIDEGSFDCRPELGVPRRNAFGCRDAAPLYLRAKHQA